MKAKAKTDTRGKFAATEVRRSKLATVQGAGGYSLGGYEMTTTTEQNAIGLIPNVYQSTNMDER